MPECKVSVIPFGINNTAPNTAMTSEEAKQRLGLCDSEVATLFFRPDRAVQGAGVSGGRATRGGAMHRFRLVIAGKVKKGCETYWRDIERPCVEGARSASS